MLPSHSDKQYVELFHLLFLSHLGRKLDKKLYALKGGCNMRFFFNSIRYSEDMDIDVQIIAKETLQNKVQSILDAVPFSHILQAKDIMINDVSASKQTHTTQRWKISLKTSKSALPLPTKIEFSRRHFGNDVIFEAINSQLLRQYSLAPILANHYSVNSMYEQKIQALALRNQPQARDIVDLYFLINAMDTNLKLRDHKTLQCLSEAKANATAITFTDFKGQVLAYLTADYYAQYNNKSVWENIVASVIENLDAHKNETH